MTKCSVSGCKNTGTHTFPKDPAIKRKWTKALKKKKFEPTKYSRLCREHFNENDYESTSISTSLHQEHKYLKKNAVPSIFWWNQKPIKDCDIARAERYTRRCARRNIVECFPSQTLDIHSPNMLEPCVAHDQNILLDNQGFVSTSDQTVLDPPESEIDVVSMDDNRNGENDGNVNSEKQGLATVNMCTQTATVFSIFSSDFWLSDDESLNYFIGLESIEKFKLILSTLLPMAESLEYRWGNVLNISIEDQLIMVLIKLRRAKPDFELSKMFGVSKAQVSNIIVTWINFISDVWSLIDIWPSKELVDFYMPDNFKQDKLQTRVIIDCTEIPIEKPSNPRSQQITFSSYKNTNTLKFLVGSSPGGLLSYCSEGYGGSVSDRQMIERSNLMNLCEEGDSIMADRGFNVQDIFAPRNIAINIPTFLKGRSQLPGIALLKDRKIASQRVHIERLIGLTKTYKILKNPLRSYYVPLASKIFFICVMLCNFKECIMNKTSE